MQMANIMNARASRNELEDFFEKAAMGLQNCASDGTILRVNQAQLDLLGYRRDEYVGRNVVEFHVDQEVIGDILARLRAGETVSGQEARLRRKDGSIRYVLIDSNVLWEDGEFLHTRCFIRDITDHKNTEEALRRANVRLEREVADRARAEEALRAEQRFLKRLFELQENERRLVAYDIHDGPVQYATGALMHLDAYVDALEDRSAPAPIDLAIQLLRKTLAEGRQLINGIRPPVLDEYGISAAIEHLIHDQDHARGYIDFVKDAGLERLEPTLETAIYRIVQEAVANAKQHSGSDKVRISLAQEDSRIVLEIRDWGRGFDPASVPDDRHGLHGIQERVRLLGGELTIDTSPGGGACIAATLPLLAGGSNEAESSGPGPSAKRR